MTLAREEKRVSTWASDEVAGGQNAAVQLSCVMVALVGLDSVAGTSRMMYQQDQSALYLADFGSGLGLEERNWRRGEKKIFILELAGLRRCVTFPAYTVRVTGPE